MDSKTGGALRRLIKQGSSSRVDKRQITNSVGSKLRWLKGGTEQHCDGMIMGRWGNCDLGTIDENNLRQKKKLTLLV